MKCICETLRRWSARRRRRPLDLLPGPDGPRRELGRRARREDRPNNRRIRQIAVENGVPIVENPPLAQALYKSVDVGQEIPAHLYRAVAEILAYIFKLMNGRLPG